MLTTSVIGLSAPTFDGDRLYWLEARADQGGRVSLWREDDDGEPEEVTPSAVERPEPGQRVRRRRVRRRGRRGRLLGGHRRPAVRAAPRRTSHEPITPGLPLRYADLHLHPERNLVLAVREDHRADGEPVTTLVGLDLDGDNPDGGRVLCEGADFYAGSGARRRRPAGVERMEPPAHAVGRIGAHGRRSGRTAGGSPGRGSRAGRRRPARRGDPPPVGARRAAVLPLRGDRMVEPVRLVRAKAFRRSAPNPSTSATPRGGSGTGRTSCSATTDWSPSGSSTASRRSWCSTSPAASSRR